MHDDTQLLRDYTEEGSEPAFRALVGRHIALVHAAARRVVAGDSHLAQDVTQMVFTDLARKAATLSRGVVLAGWLHRHTCFTAAKVVRTESRRRARERTAMEMNALNESPAHDAQWRQLAPVLDEALNSLAAADRDAIALRFLERRDLRSIGAALGTNEDAAQKRIARALEKLRDYLTRRGLTFSTALLATTLDAGAATAPVPAGLAAAVSAAALSEASAFTLISLLKTMITSKCTIGIAALAALTAVTTVVVGQNKSSDADAKAPAPPTVVAPTDAAKETKSAAATAPAPTSQIKRQSVVSGNMPANLPPGSFSGGSGSVRMKGNTVTVTTTENGVTETVTREIPAEGTTMTTSNGPGGGGFSAGRSAPGTKPGAYAGTAVIDQDGNVQMKRTEFTPDANGVIRAGAAVGVIKPDPESDQVIIVHDHTPPKKKGDEAKPTAPAPK